MASGGWASRRHGGSSPRRLGQAHGLRTPLSRCIHGSLQLRHHPRCRRLGMHRVAHAAPERAHQRPLLRRKVLLCRRDLDRRHLHRRHARRSSRSARPTTRCRVSQRSLRAGLPLHAAIGHAALGRAAHRRAVRRQPFPLPAQRPALPIPRRPSPAVPRHGQHGSSRAQATIHPGRHTHFADHAGTLVTFLGASATRFGVGGISFIHFQLGRLRAFTWIYASAGSPGRRPWS